MAESEQNQNVDVTQQNNVSADETTKAETPFREFKTQKEFDDFSAYLLKKGEEKALKNAKVENGQAVFNYQDYEKKYRKDLEAQIIADYERKAKMTAEERAEELAKEREKQFRDREIALNKREAQVLLADAGFDETEMEVYLDFVNEDREASLGRIQRVCDTQKSKLAKQKQAIIEELQANSPNIKIGGVDDNSGLQARYNDALAKSNLNLASAIIREAHQKGITLKQ